MSCGTAAGEGNSLNTVVNSVPSTHNIIEYDEDTKSRRFRAQISDAGLESVSNPLASFMLGAQFGGTSKQRRPNSEVFDGRVIIPNAVDDTSGEQLQNDSIESGEPIKALPPSENSETLRKVFRSTEGGKLNLSDARLKQQSKRDFVKRITILFLLAHEVEGREEVTRRELSVILEEAKVYDGNARKWISDTDLVERDGESVRLSFPGRELSQKLLGEYNDQNAATKWTVESKLRTRTSRKKGSDDSEESSEKSTSGRRAVGASYKAKTAELLESGFFSEGRTGKDVKAELSRKGFEFDLFRINQALVENLKKNKLTRNKDASGDWIYENA